jgi:type-F conjugative transfer system pilin assembly protein TrbC
MLRLLILVMSLVMSAMLISLGGIGVALARDKQPIKEKQITEIITSEDKALANDLRKQAGNIAKDELLAKYQELLKLEKLKNLKNREELEHEGIEEIANVTGIPDIEDITKQRARLQIFVSSSMSKELLRSYHRAAMRYGGSLVFNGLPEASFKGLSKLVLSIAKPDELGAMEIDDEAFKRFSVTTVPTIVLSKEEGLAQGTDCILEENCKITFDRVSGSIGVRVALENFAESGDLSQEAQKLLQR